VSSVKSIRIHLGNEFFAVISLFRKSERPSNQKIQNIPIAQSQTD
jgi:hypothetical protein